MWKGTLQFQCSVLLIIARPAYKILFKWRCDKTVVQISISDHTHFNVHGFVHKLNRDVHFLCKLNSAQILSFELQLLVQSSITFYELSYHASNLFLVRSRDGYIIYIKQIAVIQSM